MTSIESSFGKSSRQDKRPAREAGAPKGKPTHAKAGCGKAGRAGGRLARHDFFVAFRQLVPFALVAMAAFLVAMPVATAAIPDTSIFNLDYVHDQMKFRFWSEELTYPVVLGAAAFGVVLGVRSFRFLLVKCESTAVLSLPLSRACVFFTRFAACLCALVVGIGVPLFASLVVNVAALGIWEGLFEQFFYVLAGLLLTGALACAAGALACAVAGTLAEAVAFAVALLASVSVAAWGANVVMDYLLVGNAAGEMLYNGTDPVAPSLLEATAAANPLLFFVSEAAAHQVFIVQHPLYAPVAGNWALLACWLAACAVATALALGLVCRRKGERAGIAGLSMPLSAIVGIVVGVAAFGATFTLLASLNVIAAIAASFVAFWVVSAVLFAGPLRAPRGAKRACVAVGAESAVLAVAVAAVAFGGLGFAGAVPAAADIARVSVSYTGSPSYLATKFETAKAGDGAYYFSAEYSFDDAASIEAVRVVHQGLTETGSMALGQNDLDFGATVMPYDVVIRYTMQDGSEMVRYYDRATLNQLDALAALDDADRVRELERAVITGDFSLLSDEDAQNMGRSSARQAYAFGDIYLVDRLYAQPLLLSCDAEARGQLLTALAEDVAAQSAQDRYHPASACRGVLMFTQSGDEAADTFAYSVDNAVIYLTDEFTNTLQWFEDKGLTEYLALADEAGAVESITVQHYAPFDGMNAVTDPQSAYFMGYRAAADQQFVVMQDFGTKFSTSEPDQVAELVSLARNVGYLNSGGYLLSCKLAGEEGYAYLLIPEADAPEWLIRAAG